MTHKQVAAWAPKNRPHDDRTSVWLAIANKHQVLEELFTGQRWAGGAWKQAVEWCECKWTEGLWFRPILWNQMKSGAVSRRCTLVLIEAVLPGGIPRRDQCEARCQTD